MKQGNQDFLFFFVKKNGGRNMPNKITKTSK